MEDRSSPDLTPRQQAIARFQGCSGACQTFDHWYGKTALHAVRKQKRKKCLDRCRAILSNYDSTYKFNNDKEKNDSFET